MSAKESCPGGEPSWAAISISAGDEPSIPVQSSITPCPNCLEFFLRGHVEGQAHARAADEDMADKVARRMRALELEHEANRTLARAAVAAIDRQAARNAPGSTYVPMRGRMGAS